MSRRIHFLWLCMISLVVLLAAGCAQIGDLFAQETAEPTPIPVVDNADTFIAEARVVPAGSASLAFLVNGRIDQILVKEGDVVEKEALLISLGEREQAVAAQLAAAAEVERAQQTLDTLKEKADLAKADAERTVAQAKAALVEAQRAVDVTLTQAFQDDLDDREEQLQDRKTELTDAKETLDKYLDLATDNPTRTSAQSTYDDALESYNDALYERDRLVNQKAVAAAALTAAQEGLAQAERDAKDLAGGPDPDLLAQAQSALDAAKAQHDSAARMLSNMDLKAPFAGLVAEVKPQESGAPVAAGQTMVVMANTTEWFVETTDLTELDVVKVDVGDEVAVSFDALPGEEVTGVVESVGHTYTEKSGDVLYRVRIRLAELPEKVRWGMTAMVEFGR